MVGIAKKILLVDEDEDVGTLLHYKTLLEKGFSVEALYAGTLKTAREIFNAERGNICVMIVDGYFPGEGDVDPFVAEVRAAGWSGPIIAASIHSRVNARLLRAGCSHGAQKILAHDLAFTLMKGTG
jgi:DNA-binding response OmpR family regulator